jgi:aminoglycoside 6'-N-acetyltransferase I
MQAWVGREDAIALVAQRADGGLCGFAEIGARSVADGCDSSPVAYLEGWYVDPDLRGRGVGAALVQAAEDWARAHGYVELASDAELGNVGGQRAHTGVGFIEVGRAVLYLKSLARAKPG